MSKASDHRGRGWRTSMVVVDVRRRVVAAAVIGLSVFVLWLLQRNDPMQARPFVVCPTWAWGGVYCPGCGATRATHHLLNGRWLPALHNNLALVWLGVPVLIWVLIRESLVAIRGVRVDLDPPGWLTRTLIVGLFSFVVLRNLPLDAFDVIRPIEPEPVADDSGPQDESVRTGSSPSL